MISSAGFWICNEHENAMVKATLKVGVSGVRGIVGDSLTPQIAASFAQAFGVLIGSGPVVVGRDTRPTGKMLEHAVTAGLKSVGCEPVIAGVVSTPTLLHLTKDLDVRGGICITASHNAVPWNALKFVDRDGMFLNEGAAQELFDVYHQEHFPLVEESRLRAIRYVEDPFWKHEEAILDYVDVDAIRAAKFKVALDACNGAGAVYAPAFLEKLGCEVHVVHGAPTGVFEREPEPTPESLGALSACVKENGCDIGFAQDPDADRLALVNELGEPMGEDLTLALGIEQVLRHHGTGPIAVNLSSSKAIDFVARRHDCPVTRTRIGEINVSSAMVELGAVAGGEPNGGLIIPAIHPCRDSFAAMAILLELMALSRQSIQTLREEIPIYHIIKEKLPIRGDQAPGILRKLRRHFEGEKLNLIDGVFADLGDKWFHVRPSNTESVIRVLAEAPSAEEAKALVDMLKALITS
ncbi:MAG: phosphomannomutase [Candidatus Omnitrophota bacterium]|jgi:phosphomannomutase